MRYLFFNLLILSVFNTRNLIPSITSCNDFYHDNKQSQILQAKSEPAGKIKQKSLDKKDWKIYLYINIACFGKTEY
jgi:hypothetical protein